MSKTKKQDPLVISLQLSVDQILEIENLVESTQKNTSVLAKDRFKESIFRDLKTKITDKAHTLKKQLDLWETSKKFKINFKFHEAVMLEYLLQNYPVLDSVKTHNDLRLILLQLSPKIF